MKKAILQAMGLICLWIAIGSVCAFVPYFGLCLGLAFAFLMLVTVFISDAEPTQSEWDMVMDELLAMEKDIDK